jgi:hypothetical protein
MATKGKSIKPDREAQPKKGGNGYPAPKGKPMRGERTATHKMKKVAGRGR